MSKPKAKPAKLLIVCHDNDGRAKEALKLAAATLTVESGLRYTWRRESGCLIGRVESETFSPFPVFLIGPCGMDFSSFEGHNACTLGAGILVSTCNIVKELRLERPKHRLRSGILERPLFGLKRAVVITDSFSRGEAVRKKRLVESAADTICGAVKIGSKPHRVLFTRTLRVMSVTTDDVVETGEHNESATAVV